MDQFTLHETVTVQLRKIGLPHGSAHGNTALRSQETGPAVAVVPLLRIGDKDVMLLRLPGLAAGQYKGGKYARDPK
jgi:hypothetical protein